MKLSDLPVAQPGRKISALATMTKQDLQLFLDGNKDIIAAAVERIDRENAIMRLQIERDEFEKALLAAQANLDQIIVYSEQALAEVRILVEDTRGRMEQLEDSNNNVEKIIAAEAARLIADSRLVISGLSADANTDLRAAISLFANRLEEIYKTHQHIAADIRADYEQQNEIELQTVILWVWRWLIFAMIMLTVKYSLGVQGIFSWIKVWTGLALFN
ncbi:hypothetical protein [Anaerospora hongkongensis]|uniref:hypothetical protein n=1 Tax=Anaerospora hongkongensis TaxID=244830 RepID=UPI00289A3EF7|nr:hypothetical protein [Anaerospora hongkongensis]